jgi:hypothetical protein
MDTFLDEPTARYLTRPAEIDEASLLHPSATQARPVVGWHRFALVAGLLAVPAAAGIACAWTRPRRGLIAGGLTALALGALRLELARWFTPEPAFRFDGKMEGLELRQCSARIEAITEIEDSTLEAALDHGYDRLISYVCGANDRRELLSRTMPVLTAMRAGRYTVAFVMPPGRELGDLPRPDHSGITLREVPAHTIATLRFRGRFTRDNVAAHERALLRNLVDAGLATRGSIAFAAYDSPLTLPALRRNEVWIETV